MKITHSDNQRNVAISASRKGGKSFLSKNEDIYSNATIPDIQSYYTDDAVSRYIHSLIPEIADLLESEGYDVSFDQDANNLYISIYPSGEDYKDGTYTFPKSALTCKDVKTDASNIVEILMNRASFEDLYACESITAAKDSYNTDCRYYVYNVSDKVVSDPFQYQDDAIEFAIDKGYPIVKIHRYFYDEGGKIRPDGDPAIVWSAAKDSYNTNKCINCSTLEDKRNPNNPYRYVTKHGIGPGTLPKDVHLMDWEDLDNYRTAIYLDRPLSNKELDEYDIYPESIQASSSEYDTVSSCDVKSEANRLFKYLKDYGAISITNNIDTIDIKFSNDPDISDVNLIYHAIISQGYSHIAHHSKDPVVFEFISENGCICVKLLSYDSSEVVVEVSQEPEYISSSYDYDDEYVSEWEEIASKVVLDSDGFWTDYTLYRNVITGQYICMFGDKDIYEPDEDYADWSGDSEKIAREWFDNYQGDAPYEDPYDDYLNSQTGVTGRF